MKDRYDILSLGAGVQSSTLALMAESGETDFKPDFHVFADTGDEPDEVYDWLATLKRMLSAPVHIVKSSYGSLSQNLFKWGFSQIPAFKRGKDGKVGVGRRQCTRYWKIRPINREIKIQTGTYRKRVPDGTFHVWKGISTDEASRAKDSPHAWERAEFPLLDKGISRKGCVAWLNSKGLAAPKSACFFCPLKDQESWARVSENPKLWPKAIAIDRQLNERGEFLHSSCEPLESKPFLKAGKEPNHWNNECEGHCGV